MRLLLHGGAVLSTKGNFPWETLDQTFPLYSKDLQDLHDP